MFLMEEKRHNVESFLELSQKKLDLPSACFSSFIESIYLMSAAALMTPFVNIDLPIYFHPIFTAGSVGFINFYLRLPQALLQFEDVLTKVQTVRSIFFANFDTIYRATLVHEYGHFLVANYLFPHSNPKLQLYPPYGGTTKFKMPVYNHFINGMKENQALILISASGVGMETAWSFITLLIAQLVGKHCPEIKSHLRTSAIYGLVGNLSYALSAVWNCTSTNNDFCALKQRAGIHPLTAVFVLLSSTMLWQLALCYLFPMNIITSQENKEKVGIGESIFGLFGYSTKRAPNQESSSLEPSMIPEMV